MPFSTTTDDSIANLVQRLDVALNVPEGRIITFIASRSGEGTSTIARDYAHALADAVDHKILLIDAGTLNMDFYIANDGNPSVTIADTVAAEKPLNDALYPLGRHVFFGRWAGQGRSRSNAGKILNDDKFWQTLHKTFGTVIIDAPSIKDSPDGIGLAVRADATVLVVEAEATRQPVVENLRDTLTAAGAKILGIVLNKRRLYIPANVYENL